MPRIYTSESEPLDFCKRCFPKTEEKAYALYGNVGDGPDDRGNCFGYDCPHPPYSDNGWNDYRCEKCKNKLADNDD